MLQALIFDVDGTLADTESAHLSAFNQAFAQAGLDWHWDLPRYTELLAVSGGKERIRAYWESRGDLPQGSAEGSVDATIAHIHALKNSAYEEAVQDGHVRMRPGVLPLMVEATEAGMALAIATTTSPVNIAVLLRAAIGPDWKTCLW